jgi:uncharacterized SAM-binding protein YcdF (DUF218 family)
MRRLATPPEPLVGRLVGPEVEDRPVSLGNSPGQGKPPWPGPAPLRRCPCLRIGGAALLIVMIGVVAMLAWGGDLLVARDPLPAHADVLVVLAGSIHGELVRREEAVRLLRGGRADQLVLSAPEVTYLGEWVPDLMRRDLERSYGIEPARRAVLCFHNADSTLEEAQALRPCLERPGWRTLIVVTSNYHTRRARHIWREVFREADPPVRIFVHGVSDGDFEPRGWWRHRRYVKTFALETTKLVWKYLFE